MATSRVYRQRRRAESTAETRRRIMDAVRDLLERGEFHRSSVEEIAERAGVARATLYQHFGSRLGLVDAICQSFSENPSMAALKASRELEDPAEAAVELVRQAMRFWAAEEALHRNLYGLATIDDAARDFVRRQGADRRSYAERVLRRLREAGRLRRGIGENEALALLLLPSFKTYEELRAAGLSLAQAEELAVAQVRELVGG